MLYEVEYYYSDADGDAERSLTTWIVEADAELDALLKVFGEHYSVETNPILFRRLRGFFGAKTERADDDISYYCTDNQFGWFEDITIDTLTGDEIKKRRIKLLAELALYDQILQRGVVHKASAVNPIGSGWGWLPICQCGWIGTNTGTNEVAAKDEAADHERKFKAR
jgi:hypothetical protein